MHKLIVFSLCAAFATFAMACGEEETSSEPELSELQVTCVDSSQEGVDSQVLESVSVRATDADRDLVSVEGTINSLQMVLTDEDADERFSWSPPDAPEPVICSGEFAVSVTAFDADDNRVDLFEIVEK